MTRPIFPDEPIRFSEQELNRLLRCCLAVNASDVTIRSNARVFAHVAGRIIPVTNRRLENSEVELLAKVIYGDNAVAEIRQGKPIDPSYPVKIEKGREARFRVNATGALLRGEDGIEITMRAIPSDPPRFEDLGIEQDLCQNIVHRQGLALISGPTGSGKTTLLAATIRSVLENPESNTKIITYEAPIEFTYDRFDQAAQSSFITQSEVGRHIVGRSAERSRDDAWAESTRNAMRRASTIMLYGECRDRETMSAAIEGSNTGHMVYTTLHSLGVAKTLMRVSQLFQADVSEQLQMMLLACDNLRVVVSQTLLRRIDDQTKRVALREYLVFTPEIREELLWLDEPMKIVNAVRLHMQATGRALEHQAEKLYAERVISLSDFLKIRQAGGVKSPVSVPVTGVQEDKARVA